MNVNQLALIFSFSYNLALSHRVYCLLAKERMREKALNILSLLHIESEATVQEIEAFHCDLHISWNLIGSISQILFEFINTPTLERICASE